MKKRIVLSMITISLLSVAQAADYGRMNMGFAGMPDIQDHVEEASHNSAPKNDDQKTASSAAASSSVAQATPTGEASVSEEAASSASAAKPQEHQHPPMPPQSSSWGMEQGEEAYSSTMSSEEEAHSSAISQTSSTPDWGLDKGNGAYSSAMSHAEAAHSSAMDHASSAHSMTQKDKNFIEMIPAKIPANLPPQVKEALIEAKKAAKFYKHPELFEDLNVTDIDHLDPETIDQIRQRAQKAMKERSKEIAANIIKNRPKVKLPVAGDFVRIGDGQYDWAFVTKNGKVYKLAGVNEDGNFKYEALPGAKAVIDDEGNVKFLKTDGLNLTDTTFKGYPFAKYNDPNENGFDWIVVTKNGKVYKLEGFDPDSKSFVYTPADGLEAQQQGEEVEVLPGS